MANSGTGFAPHEVLMARPFPLGVLMDKTPAKDLTLLQETQQHYVKQLWSFVSEINQVTDFLPTPGGQSIHNFQLGDYVLVHSLKTLAQQDQPRFGPPTQVLLATITAVKVLTAVDLVNHNGSMHLDSDEHFLQQMQYRTYRIQ